MSKDGNLNLLLGLGGGWRSPCCSGPYLRSALLHFLLNLEIRAGSLWGRFCMRFHFYRGGAACFWIDSDA